MKRLTKMFVVHGIPDKLVTDNGPQFISHKFKQFAIDLHFSHVTTSPHNHKANGMVERANQTIRHLMEKSQEDNNNFYLALLKLRNTPRHTDTGSPAQRLFGRRTKTKLPTTEALLNRESWNRKMCAIGSTRIVIPRNITMIEALDLSCPFRPKTPSVYGQRIGGSQRSYCPRMHNRRTHDRTKSVSLQVPF